MGVLGLNGRMGRLSFFLWSLALGAAVTMLTFAATFAMLRADGSIAREPSAGLLLSVILVVGPPFLWGTLVLYGKRLRDIGWRARHVLPGWLAFNLLDSLVALAVPAVATAEGNGTAAGAIGNLVMIICLLFWPGSPDAGRGGYHSDVEPPRRRRDRDVFAPAAPPSRAPTSSAPQGFGRRRTV